MLLERFLFRIINIDPGLRVDAVPVIVVAFFAVLDLENSILHPEAPTVRITLVFFTLGNGGVTGRHQSIASDNDRLGERIDNLNKLKWKMVSDDKSKH